MTFSRLILSFSVVISTLFSLQASATTIGGISGINTFVDGVSGSNGTFYNWQSMDSADTIDSTQLNTDLSDNSEASYIFTTSAGGFVDLNFSSDDVYNGVGDDIVLFFYGENTFTFGFDVDNSGPAAAQTFDAALTGYGITDHLGRTWNLSAATIDLDDFGFGLDQQLLTDVRVFIGDEHKNPDRPLLSLVGAFHTQATVTAVPLPLPALLFASGLGLLGLVARRRS